MIGRILATSGIVVVFVAAPASAAPGAFDLSSPTNGAWCTATCTYTWGAASSAASYDLYADGTVKHAAVVGTTYTLASGEALADGWHTWYVVAKDSGGATTQSGSTWSFRVDSTPPAAFTLSAPAAGSMAISSPATFSWTASSDAQSGLDHYEVWVNGAAASAAIPATATSAAAPLPTTRFFWDPISSGCANWTVTTIAGSQNWGCATQSGVPVLTWNQGCCDSMRWGYETFATPIDLTNAGQASLRFDYESYTGTGATYAASFSDDGGTTWWDAQGGQGGTVLSIPIGDFGASWTTASANLVMAGTANAIIRFEAFDKNWTNWWSVHNVEIRGIAGTSYDWSVVAVDVAGNRTATETRQVRYDLPPLPFDLVDLPNDGWVATGTPTLSWKATSDPDAGLAKYQVWVNGSMAVDNIPATATSATLVTALADGNYRWQVYAVDAAGSVRPSRQKPWLHVDTTPPSPFSLATPADRAVSTVPTPSLCWYCTSDAAGVDHYELVVDGILTRGGIADPTSGHCDTEYATQVCATPASALSEGAHTWKVKAVDRVGNAATSTETWTVYVDFNPPAAFSLVSPGTDTGATPTLSTSMPTFTWQASSSSGSGLDHYELYVVNEQDVPNGLPKQLQGLSCTVCSISPTTTSVAVTEPLRNGSYVWSVRTVDKLGGSTVATTGNNGFFFFDVACYGACGSPPESGLEPAPEPRLEPTVEPARDAGTDATRDAGPVGPTGTSTSTATSTVSTTATSTSTATSTATATSIGAEPRPDGGTATGSDAIGADARMVVADAAATPDAVIPRDGAQADAVSAGRDAPAVLPTADGGAGSGILDVGAALTDAAALNAFDAKITVPEVGQPSAQDGGGHDGMGAGKAGASGCGCALGGRHSADSWGWSPILIGLAVCWRFRRWRGAEARRIYTSSSNSKNKMTSFP